MEWSETKVYGFMMNWMTLHQMIKWLPPSSKHTWTRRSMLLAVRHRISFCVGDLQSDVVFQGFYVARFFPVNSFLRIVQKKQIWRCQVWQSRGTEITTGVPREQWSHNSRRKIECHTAPSVEEAAICSWALPAWIGNATEAISIYFRSFVKELQAKTTRAFYMNRPIRTKFHPTPFF
jgi:hypothetical protein